MKALSSHLFSRRFFLAGVAGFSAAPRLEAAPAAPKGLRVFTCGHSFHVWAARIIADIAAGAGIKNHKIAGVSSIGGSRVSQHWELADDRFQAKKLLAAGEVDVLTISPIWLPDDGIEKFSRLAFDHNPNIRITIQEFWLPNDEYNPVYPLDVRKVVDHNATNLAELRQANARYERDMEAHVREINQRLGKNALVVVPVGAASIALREKIVSARVPGLKVQWRLFADNWGHPTPPLKALAAYCHFAVIYRRTPVGLPLPPELEQNKEFANPGLNKLLQQIAWEAVTKNPMTGVSA